MSVAFTHKVNMDSSLTTAYRNPMADSYYSWSGHEGFHRHVERTATEGQPIVESELLRFLAMPFSISNYRSMNPSAEQFKDFYDKQRKRLVKFRKDIEKCVSNLEGEPTYIVITSPGHGRQKRYKIGLYATPIDDIEAWKKAVNEWNRGRSWREAVRYYNAKPYAEFMQRLKANINFLATFDPTPHVEMHTALLQDKKEQRNIKGAQNNFTSSLNKKADELKALALWDDPEFVMNYVEKERASILRRITECDVRLRENVASLIRYGAELTEEQQAYAPEVTE